jgi:hypothetical protein
MTYSYEWQVSTYTGGQGNCVEVARNAPGTVAVRDSKDPDGPVLRLSPEQWRSLVARVKDGQH